MIVGSLTDLARDDGPITSLILNRDISNTRICSDKAVTQHAGPSSNAGDTAILDSSGRLQIIADCSETTSI